MGIGSSIVDALMNIARPATGFEISISANVRALIENEISKNPEFERYWGDIIERLKFVAHRIGSPEERLARGARLHAFADQGLPGRPRVVVGYVVLGKTVNIKLLRVS